jgi:hypothetical protein
MRCEDVIGALAAPKGGPVPAALAEHLARCPRCAAWSERDAKLSRLVEATRPSPPPGAWETIWAHASEALDRPRATPAPALPRRRLAFRRASIVWFSLAQAAAIFLVILAWPRPRPEPGPGPIQLTQPAQSAVPPESALSLAGPIEIDEGQTVLISVDRKVVQVRDLNPSDGPEAINRTIATGPTDRNLAMYNVIEPLASIETMASVQ